MIVSGIHLELTPSLKTFVQEKAERLFRHEERIIRLRVELEFDAKQAVGARFKAKGHVMINGPDLNASVEAEECHKAVALLVDKLDRMMSDIISPPPEARTGKSLYAQSLGVPNLAQTLMTKMDSGLAKVPHLTADRRNSVWAALEKMTMPMRGLFYKSLNLSGMEIGRAHV